MFHERKQSYRTFAEFTGPAVVDINEVVDSDFLISPGDIFLNRKVELEDADIKE